MSVALQLDISSISNYSSNLIDYLFVRHKEEFLKVATNAIRYMEASGSYCQLHLIDNKIILVSIPLSKVSEHLLSDSFIRIHRSFIINLVHVYSLVGNSLTMEGGAKLPIGREYKKAVLENFTLIGTKSRKYVF